MNARASALALALVGSISLVLTTFVNRTAQSFLADSGLRLPWLAETCVASCAACVLVYLAIRPARPFAGPDASTDRRGILRLSSWWLALWLAGSAIVGLARGGWVRYASGAPALVGFLLLAPLGEELLFRGAIFELAERALPQWRSAPVVVSSVFFSLHHLQLHGFRWSAASASQVAFTFPMGLVLASLRQRSGSLGPGLVVHVLTNLPGAFGS